MASPYDQLPSVYREDAFRGKVFGVTGSGHGIGEATVRQLATLGAAVVVIDLDEADLRRVEADLKNAQADALCLVGDVADQRVLKKAIMAAHKRWGRIDGWVNNAMYNPWREPETLEPAELERTWQVNVGAAWQAVALLTPLMREAGGGSIVNLSSILAHQPYAGSAAYGATKSAIEGLTRALAVDLSPHRIRVNTIIPGSINTNYGPPGFRIEPVDVPEEVKRQYLKVRQRFRELVWRHMQPWPVQGQARDAADAILFLLSDAARFITGASLFVDGGASVSTRHPFFHDNEEMVRLRKKMRALIEKHPSLRPSYRADGRKPARRGRK